MNHNRTIYSDIQQVDDLNTLTIDDEGAGISLDTAPVSQGGITVHFRNLEARLVECIRRADAILGCVAWLTNKNIIAALAEKDPVSIIVQKEDFLRPDLKSGRGWPAELRRRYDQLTCSWMRYYMPDIVSSLTTLGDSSVQPVRCVGNYNRDKSPAFPRMHHKFIVFCRTGRRCSDDLFDGSHYYEPALKPYAVWTGSFNFTENAGRSLENAIIIEKRHIVDAYVEEWARILALSEPLNWEFDWVAPEWRIGS